MTYNNNILLGRITKVNGYEGAVTVKLEKSYIENIPQMESVFLEIEGRPVPFFISSSGYSGADILKLKFEDYDSIEKISEFTGCRVFLTTAVQVDDIREKTEDLTGYTVLTHDDTELGVIKEIIPNPGQWLLSITASGNRELLIPFHEDFIISIENNRKIVVMNLPEGLTELN